MLYLTIDNPTIENYFANSTDKLKEFLERFVSDDTAYAQDNEEQYNKAIKDLANKDTISSQNARAILGV